MAGQTRFQSFAGGLIIAAALAFLGGCSALGLPSTEGLMSSLTPYRMDIVQGNVVTKEQAALVKPGMPRNQVRDILGSPMLTDLFHADRWDYVFTIVRQGTAPQRRTLVAFFKDDRLERLEAPDLPSERDFVASISRNDGDGKPPPALALTPEQQQALPKPPKPEPEAPAPGAVARTYPPLEPS